MTATLNRTGRDIEANDRAMELRGIGVSYGDITRILAHEHGYWLSEAGWRYRLRTLGAPLTNPERGRRR